MRPLAHYRFHRGRWRLASLVHARSVRGRAALDDELILRLIPEGRVLGCRYGVKIRMHRDPMYVEPFLFGVYEHGATLVYRRLVKPGMTVVDVGANFGWYSALFGGSCKVLAFEPVPSNVALLRDTVELNSSSVKVHDFGLGAASGQFTVFTFDGLPHGHASAYDLGRADARPHQCQVRRLDDVVDGADFVKIDVEGYEPDVLEGARRILMAHRPALAFETNVECLSARSMRPRDVWGDRRRSRLPRAAVWRITPSGRLIEQSDPPADTNACQRDRCGHATSGGSS